MASLGKMANLAGPWKPDSADHVLEQRFGAVNCFRNYDTQTETLTFMGQDFPIRPVEQAVNALQQAIAPHLT